MSEFDYSGLYPVPLDPFIPTPEICPLEDCRGEFDICGHDNDAVFVQDGETLIHGNLIAVVDGFPVLDVDGKKQSFPGGYKSIILESEAPNSHFSFRCAA